MNDFPVTKMRALDKITARTLTFEAQVGSTFKFGSLYIKPQACRKAPPIEPPESAAFLQIWEATSQQNVSVSTEQPAESEWVFSGWMFASSPALSYMDHPIYDVWVLDCLEQATQAVTAETGELREGEGEVAEEEGQEALPEVEVEELPEAKPAEKPVASENSKSNLDINPEPLADQPETRSMNQ